MFSLESLSTTKEKRVLELKENICYAAWIKVFWTIG